MKTLDVKQIAIAANNGIETIILLTADGSVWEMCNVGNGWTEPTRLTKSCVRE